MNLARFALRNDKAIVFVVIVLSLLGVRAYLDTPQSIFPTMNFPRIDVVADAGDLPPDYVRVAIARPLERAFQVIPSVSSVVATSSQGSAELFVNFAESTDPQAALQAVDQALSTLRAEVPAAKSIVAATVNPNREPVLSYAFTSPDISQTLLRQLALAQVAPKLYGTLGLGQLLVTGGSTAEFHVALDPAQLLAHGIGAPDVAKTLANANDVQGVGVAQRYYQNYAILLDTSIADRTSLERLEIPTRNGVAVPLASLGRVSLGVSPATNQTSIDGRHAVFISVYAAPGADAVAMARTIRARLDAVEPSLPRDVSVTPFWDQTTLVTASQNALRDAILLGALLAVIVIYVFLRSTRLTLVAAAIIPLAMSIALLALQATGQTLNLMSVGGLAVAVGLIIDDAIVVIEGIAHNRRAYPELGTDGAIERTMDRLSGAMIASTLATVVVFLPLALLTGVTGYFFRALAFTLSASLLVSLCLALLVAPILARSFLSGGKERAERPDPMDGAATRYLRLLRWTLERPVVVGVASAAVLAVTVLLLTHLSTGFLPRMDEGQFEVGYTLPVGASLAASDAAARVMERIVRADPAVASVAALTGVDSNGVSPTQSNQGALRVRLIAPDKRAGYEVVSDRLRNRLSDAVPSAQFDFRQILEDLINDLSGTPAPIEISITGDDQQRLIALAQRVTEKISTVPGVVDAANGVTYDGPSLRIAPRGTVLAALGLTPIDVGDALSAVGTGTVATTLLGSQALVPVRVAVDSPGSALDPSTPLYVSGNAASLGDIATVATSRLQSDIVTQNGQLVDQVTANFQGSSLSTVTAGIRDALRTVPLPPGYSIEIGGQARSQARSFSEFASVIGIAVALVFCVMLATFRSFRVPLVILTAVPLALIGVALSLFVTQTEFNVSSFMGLLLLVGLVVKNGILLIDAANRRRAEGANVEDALLDAGRARLRPIVMTTLAAIGGLFPLALGIGQGAEMEKPLAIAVIGGLSTATLFTLIVIPVLYSVFMSARRVRSSRQIAATLLALGLLASFAAAARAQSPQTATRTPAPASLAFVGLSLERATSAALANSPDVEAARARVDESRFALAGARGAALPSLVSTYAQVPQGNPPGPNVTSREVSAGLQWTVGDLLGYPSGVRAAAETLAASEADESALEISERIKVAGLYYDALKARAVATAARDALALALAERGAANVRYKAGDAPELDVTRADVAVARAQADLELALAGDENASDALSIETGVPATAIGDPAAAPVATAIPAPIDPESAMSLARAFRPEIASADRTVRAAQADIDAAKAASFPAVTFGGGYLVGTDSGVPVNAPTINANLTLPLGGATRSGVAIAVARATELRAKADSVRRQILLEVAASARSLAAAERAAEATTRARESAAIELHATEVGYRNGASSSLELTTARSGYAAAVVDELSASYDLAKARATLDIEVGR